jgi:hypothetical protein
MSNKNKHTNIRIDSKLLKQLEDIQKEFQERSQLKVNRSQIIEMLIEKGIKKYHEEIQYPFGN